MKFIAIKNQKGGDVKANRGAQDGGVTVIYTHAINRGGKGVKSLIEEQ